MNGIQLLKNKIYYIIMYKIILILCIILILILEKNTYFSDVNNTTSINNHEYTNNINLKNINNIDLKNIDDANTTFHKQFFTSFISDKELEIIDINKGKLTNQHSINENGGSLYYNKYYINSNISGNTINYDNNYSSYINLPATK